MTANNMPKLHNAMWPGLVGKGPDSEPHIELDTMLDLTANAARLKLSRARKRMRQSLREAPGLERLEPGTRHAF